jgi:cold shock CspA family protein
MSKHIGQVKWFNNKIGYGFVTLLNEETTKDVFVHHMNIKPVESNYRTLKIGEFVEFELDDTCEGQHNEQAVNVTGICGKELQCDWVHRINKKKKFSKHKQSEDGEGGGDEVGETEQ